jgi:hypothetical protein
MTAWTPHAEVDPLERTSSSSTPDDEGNDMYPHHPNAALDEELAYRRQLLEEAAIKSGSGRRGGWFRPRRRPR